MEQYREADIRDHVEFWLKQQGIAVEREVSCGNGIRADLVTPDMVIEVKKYLNRGTIYQAHGQGIAYQKHLNKPKLLIIGFAPASETRYQEAQRIAENIRTEGVEIVFLDKDPQWAAAMAAMPVPAKIAPVKATAESKSPVLPFEKVAAATASKAESSSAKAADSKAADSKAASKAESSSGSSSASDDRPTFGIRDFWTLLWIILLFLWLRSALVTADRAEEQPLQPTPQERKSENSH